MVTMPHLILKRIYAVDYKIRNKTYPNKNSLADTLKVSTRTIARYLDFLKSELKAEIKFNATKNGFYYTKEPDKIGYIPISEDELFSIMVFNILNTQYNNTPFEEKIQYILNKIIQSLPEELISDAKFLMDKITFILGPISKINQSIFNTILKAFKTTTSLQIQYCNNNNEKSQRKIDVYHLAYQQGTWYVLAFCHQKNTIKTFNLSRISSAQLTDEKFTIQNFDKNKHLDSCFGIFDKDEEYKIKLLCKGYCAKIMQEKYEDKATNIIELENNDIEIEFQTTQTEEIIKLALSFGDKMKILEPEKLVKQFKNILKNTLKQYN